MQARQHVDAVFVHCDVESLTKLAKEHAVTRIPTYGYFYNGRQYNEAYREPIGDLSWKP